MRVVVLVRDFVGGSLSDLWDIRSSHEVVAESQSGYEVRFLKFFRRWLPKKAIGMKCEIVNESPAPSGKEKE